jgi:hypothetical protein
MMRKKTEVGSAAQPYARPGRGLFLLAGAKTIASLIARFCNQILLAVAKTYTLHGALQNTPT